MNCKQVILDLIKKAGPKDVPTLVRQCYAHADDFRHYVEVEDLLEEMVIDGVLATDGVTYGSPGDVDTEFEPPFCAWAGSWR